jgi:hypothetical protein
VLNVPTFNNLNDLSNYLRQQTLKYVKEDVAEVIKDILYRYVDELLYDDFTPASYHRTYDLINSLSISEMNKVGKNEHEIVIFFDDNKIRPMIDDTSKWNQHMSSDGTNLDESSYVAEYMNYGHGGLYIQQPILFLEAALNEINSKKPHLTILKRRLKEKGFIIK